MITKIYRNNRITDHLYLKLDFNNVCKIWFFRIEIAKIQPVAIKTEQRQVLLTPILTPQANS
jgi:hypothetical protein